MEPTITVAVAAFWLLGECGCAPLQVGPFQAADATHHYCAADPDCPSRQSCRYPAASSPRPICMDTGWNDADDFVIVGEGE